MSTIKKCLNKFFIRVGFIFYILIFSGCGTSESDFEEYSRYLSPDNTSTVAILLAPAKLAYGPTSVRIDLIDEESGNLHHILSTKVANDGVPLSDNNISSSWVDVDTLHLCLSGDEQQDEQIEIKLSTASYSSSITECLKYESTNIQ